MSVPEWVTDEAGGSVRLKGALTVETVPTLAAEGLPDADGTACFHLDLSGVHHADSAGLALLVDWLASARAAGCELVFEQAPAQLVAIARVSGVAGLLSLADRAAEPTSELSTE